MRAESARYSIRASFHISPYAATVEWPSAPKATSRMSPRSFIRAFRAATGLSPIAYLIQLRISRAAVLRTTAEPVTEIAFRVGFNDSNYFTRQFVKLIGCSPRRYRQRLPADGKLPAG